VEEIDRHSDVPPYRQLASILRDEIASGEISGRLPSEKDLIQSYGLAAGTVRKALALLREADLIHTVHGWGSYTGPAE
jgi:GntR family transcriptional regulator